MRDLPEFFAGNRILRLNGKVVGIIFKGEITQEWLFQGEERMKTFQYAPLHSQGLQGDHRAVKRQQMVRVVQRARVDFDLPALGRKVQVVLVDEPARECSLT